MGKELETRVTIDGVRRSGMRVHLGSSALEIGGRPRHSIDFASLRKLSVHDGELILETREAVVSIELGEQAAAWAAKIRNPPSRAQKLGLKPELRVALIGQVATELSGEISAVGARLVEPGAKADLVFLSVESSEDLLQLPRLVKRLGGAGALWVVRRKGRGASVSETDVRSAAHAAGLVDVKVAAFSATHSADKFVIPVAARKKQAKRARRAQ